MIPTINDLPVWERTLLRQVREAQASEGQLYRELTDKFDAARRKPRQLATQWVPQPVTKHEAIAQFVDAAYALAAAILQSPADFPAHAVDFAIGLLNEAMTYVRAEFAARGSS